MPAYSLYRVLILYACLYSQVYSRTLVPHPTCYLIILFLNDQQWWNHIMVKVRLSDQLLVHPIARRRNLCLS